MKRILLAYLFCLLSAPAWAISSVYTSSAASNLVAGGTDVSLYNGHVTTSSTAGYVMIFNATSAPANGTVSPVDCFYVANPGTVQFTYQASPQFFSTGLTVLFSTTGCYTATASSTAFISVQVQ